MTNILATVQELLCHDDPDLVAYRQRLDEMIKFAEGSDRAQFLPILRLVDALHHEKRHEASLTDVLVLLRQVIRFNHRIHVSRSLWQRMQYLGAAHGLRVSQDTGGDVVEIMADVWTPAWLTNPEYIDRFQLRRKDPPAVGDGMVSAVTDQPNYLSTAQKAAVYVTLFASPGSTTLVTLPTGSGKSVCAHLPAWLATQGGRWEGGTTVAVVPTVSLADDQQLEANRYFRDAVDDASRPQSWTGATPADLRTTIRRGIARGTLPLLFTSPEALMHTELGSVCREAAENHHLHRLVIDEAHIVGSWGAGFRPEFQFLAGFRQSLLEASHGDLITVLLSATVSADTERLLERLFGFPTFQTVRANRLRPEPSYWFRHSDSESERQQRVLEALRYLPRPAILYVTRPDDAANWVDMLRRNGYRRLASYTGRTSSNERNRVLVEWKQNRLDIVVANSAFGLGVDKADVRTVIHACLPEDLDRFYQEVGRGGRDGMSSVSLVCSIPDDAQLAFALRRDAVARVETIIGRWKGMRSTRKRHPERPDIWYLDTDAPPTYDLEMLSGERNREWNEHTLLLLQRAGLLSIAEVPAEFRPPDSDKEGETADGRHGWLEVHVHQPEVLRNPEKLTERVEPIRQEERSRADIARNEMISLAEEYSSVNVDRCIATKLAELYPPCGYACGGCTYCRSTATVPYFDDLAVQINRLGPLAPHLQVPLSHQVRERLGGSGNYTLTWTGASLTTLRTHLAQLIGLLGKEGFQQFIIADDVYEDPKWQRAVSTTLRKDSVRPHTLISAKQVSESPGLWLYPLSTLVIYPEEDRLSDRLYQVVREYSSGPADGRSTVHVIHRELQLPSEHGRFIDRISYPSDDLQQFVHWLESQRVQEFVF